MLWRNRLSGGDVRNAELLGQLHRLGALARSRRTQQDDSHFRNPFVVALHQLALDLLHGVQTDADHDQNCGAAERQVLDATAVADLKEQVRQNRDEPGRSSRAG